MVARLSETELRIGQAAGFGGPPVQRRVRLVSFRLLRKGGLLRFATVAYLGLIITDCPIQTTAAAVWCGLPAKPVLDQDGRQVEISGEKQYAAVNKWRDRALSDRFSDRVVELVTQAYSDELAGEGGQ